MAKTGDVQFTTVAAVDYNYMLGLDGGGEKHWYVEQRVSLPPSLIQNKIDMVIAAAPLMTQADGTVIATRTISTVLTELRVLADQTNLITLDGFDGKTYHVSFDKSAARTTAVRDESGTVIEHRIALTCWDKKIA